MPAGIQTNPNNLQIVSPADGTQYNLGDWVIVVSEVSVGGGASQVDLLVNGEVIRSDQPSQLVERGNIQQPWRPAQPGTYLVQSRATGVDGSILESNSVSIQVGDIDVTPIPAATTQVTPEITITPTFTPTPTLGPPIATATQDSNCRFGPGSVYDITGYLLNGQSAPIVGRNVDSSWWVIQTESGVKCWIWDDLVVVSGDTGNVPIVEAPPTPTPTVPPLSAPVPVSPSGLLSCTSTVTLTWQPVSHPNGIAYYEWRVSGPGGNQSGTTPGTSQELIVACGGSTYEWKVRAIDTFGNAGSFSTDMTFTIQ
ncbi:MAG: hypothetical protein HYZ22_17545 [Chloroflexi bacterium]|nr:hypothetical protein [Chloroflexota bacterium]